MNKDFFKVAFKLPFPSFRCPHCEPGFLQLVEKSMKIYEPTYSKINTQDPDAEFDWAVRRYNCIFECSYKACSEIVCMSGLVEYLEEYEFDEQGYPCGERYVDVYKPLTFSPAPVLITIPKQAPETVKEAIESAFTLYWIDLEACTSRLRMSIELLLDELHVPRRSSKNKPLTLNQRIDEYAKLNPGSSLINTLEVFRGIGNIATHEDSIERKLVKEAFEIYEETLRELFDNKSAVINEMKNSIIKKLELRDRLAIQPDVKRVDD